MKAITIYQPWASMIIEGHKTIETRTHAGFRFLLGETIAIHAGKTWDGIGAMWAFLKWPDLREWHLRHGEYPHGAILGIARVVDTRWLSESDDGAARSECVHPARRLFGLCLADVYRYDRPLPIRGRQGAWGVDIEELRDKIAIALVEEAAALVNPQGNLFLDDGNAP